MPEETRRIWTEAEMRQELPDVSIKIGKRIYRGKVTGRLEKFLLVTACKLEGQLSWIYSAAAILNSLNTGQPLIV